MVKSSQNIASSHLLWIDKKTPKTFILAGETDYHLVFPFVSFFCSPMELFLPVQNTGRSEGFVCLGGRKEKDFPDFLCLVGREVFCSPFNP